MLKNSWDIALLYLKTSYSSRAVLIFQLLMPILFTFMIGAGTGNFNDVTTTSTSVTWEIGVILEDPGEMGHALLTAINEDATIYTTEIEPDGIETAVLDNDLLAVLHIPADFSSRLLNGEELELDLHSDPGDARRVQPVQLVVQSKINQLQTAVQVAGISRGVAEELGLFAGEMAADDYFAEGIELARSAQENPPLVLAINEDERIVDPATVIPDGIDQSSPGMMAMFATFGMMGGAAVLIQERQIGTLRRLLVMPVRKGSIILGKMTGILISGLVQMAILILFGALAFDVAWGNNPAALILMVFSFAFAILVYIN